MKILIREANWLGDAILTVPSLVALRDHFPQARITIVARDFLLPLFKLLPWKVETMSLSGMRSWLNLRQEKFDLAIIFPNSFRSALEVFLTRSRIRLGYPTCSRSLFLTEKVPLNKGRLHMMNYYYNLLEPLGIKGNIPSPILAVKEKDKEEILFWLKEKGVNLQRPLIAISAGASYGEAKCWPEGKFARLIQRLKGEGEIIFIGTKKDAPIIEKIISITGIKAFNLAGETSLSQLAAFFSTSKLVISNDNGAMHLASVLGVPVIALFGPTDPLRTGPLGEHTIVLRDKVDCSPCKKRICRSKKCFDKITVERAYEAVKKIL